MAPERDAEGRLHPDPERFPSGIKAIADYLQPQTMRAAPRSSATPPWPTQSRLAGIDPCGRRELLSIGGHVLASSPFPLGAVERALIAGNDLRSMDATTLALLTDPDVLAVNQDWAGMQGHKIADTGDQEAWTKPTSAGGAAVVLFGEFASRVTVTNDGRAPATDVTVGLAASQGWQVEPTGPPRTPRPACSR